MENALDFTKIADKKKENEFQESFSSLEKNRRNFLLLGDITALFLNCKYYKKASIGAMWNLIAAPLHLNQYRIYYNKQNLPVAFVSWAFLSDEVEKKYEAGNYNLKHNEWKSGKNFWVIDFIAPFGDAKKIFRDLYKNAFKKQNSAKFIRRNFNGTKKITKNINRKNK